MTTGERTTFIEKHRLRSDEQNRLAADIVRRIEAEKLHFVRLAWGDAHGYARAKTLTVPAFIAALTNGYNIGVATTTLDSAGARVFASFTRGGGMGLAEMTGSPNLTIVADPSTFRVLPWAQGVGWILGDEYFNDGTPFHFSPRQLLRKTLRRLADHGFAAVVGPEIEWYLLRVATDHLSDENIGAPGIRGRPIKTAAVEPGYHYHSESNMDLMQPVFDALGEAFETLGLGLRSIENEWGPGQVECTFAPRAALEAADNVFLFRTATRQICRRLGYFATFMCRPALKGFYSSGWHLHQSLIDASTGANLFMPQKTGEILSPLGQSYLAGLSAIRGTRHRLCDAHGQRLSPVSPKLAGARSGDVGVRSSRRDGSGTRRCGRSGNTAGESDRRACGQSLSFHSFAGLRRACRY
jgi:glutamine synthetase